MRKLVKVMFIEDDALTNLYYKMLVETFEASHQQIEHQYFQDPREALSQIFLMGSAGLPDYIFLDIKMPKLSGWGFLEAYETMPFAKANVIIISQIDPSEVRLHALRNHLVLDYQSKPISLTYLQSWLLQLVPTEKLF